MPDKQVMPKCKHCHNEFEDHHKETGACLNRPYLDSSSPYAFHPHSRYMPDKQITIIHPSRSRAELAFKSASQWVASAGMDVEYILGLDEDDPQLNKYTEVYTGFNRLVVTSKNRSAVDAINNAAKLASGDILIVISDDWLLPQNWAVDILKASDGKTDWIMNTPDGLQKWLITLPILDRTYYNRFGYIYFPEYRHMFADTEISCVADLTGRRIEADIQFHHKHYSTPGGIPKDAISIRADATWEQGEKLFIERYKRNFDLVNPPGKITSPEYVNWIRSKL